MKTTGQWTACFQRFDDALARLRQALERGSAALSQLEKEGAVHRFESCLELAWKTARDFLEESGLVVAPVTPREVFRQAAVTGMVPDGQVWIDMLNHRTLLAHSCDGVVLAEVVDALSRHYLAAMEQLREFLAARQHEEMPVG
jgi:nucleotidyltransferase substrate binding protein (TIGR01987 family)